MNGMVDLSQYVGASASAEEGASVPLLSLDQLRESAKSVRWLVKHYIPMESIGLLFGASETFKSFIALDMALHVAHGLPWMSAKTRQGPVVYLAAEGGTGLWSRIDAWHRARGLSTENVPFYVIPRPVDLAADASLVKAAILQLGVEPVLITIDTVSQTLSGDENHATEVAAYLREIGVQLRLQWQCAVVLVHHTGHVATERPRGSSALKGNVDFMFGVFRDEAEMLATVECVRQKDGDRPKPVSFSMSVVELGQDEDGDKLTSLVANRVADTTEVIHRMEHEAERGRGGNNSRLLSLLQNGMEEKKLRTLFYESTDGDSDTKRQAYYRARKWAVSNGIFEVAQGTVIVLKQA